MDRVLLCIPHGGLNDTLCQIENCWRYAERFTRQLIIDTRKSGLQGHFSDFFSIKSPTIAVLARADDELRAKFNTLDCFPPAIKGRLGQYTIGSTSAVSNWVDKDTGTPLTFDFKRDYSEPLLVHEQFGGGGASRRLLMRGSLTLSPRILPQVLERLSSLPPRYLAVHVRHTDLKTDYRGLFHSIYPKVVDQNILVCSDSAEVVAYAKKFFDRSVVWTVSDIPSVNGPLHHHTYASDDERDGATISALTGILALGRSGGLFIGPTSSKLPWMKAAGHISGYSSLAAFLFQNKGVIAHLLSSPA